MTKEEKLNEIQIKLSSIINNKTPFSESEIHNITAYVFSEFIKNDLGYPYFTVNIRTRSLSIDLKTKVSFQEYQMMLPIEYLRKTHYCEELPPEEIDIIYETDQK